MAEDVVQAAGARAEERDLMERALVQDVFDRLLCVGSLGVVVPDLGHVPEVREGLRGHGVEIADNRRGLDVMGARHVGAPVGTDEEGSVTDRAVYRVGGRRHSIREDDGASHGWEGERWWWYSLPSGDGVCNPR